jgi:hypothetical protein
MRSRPTEPGSGLARRSRTVALVAAIVAVAALISVPALAYDAGSGGISRQSRPAT